jgi:hypothetical protein
MPYTKINERKWLYQFESMFSRGKLKNNWIVESSRPLFLLDQCKQCVSMLEKTPVRRKQDKTIQPNQQTARVRTTLPLAVCFGLHPGHGYTAEAKTSLQDVAEGVNAPVWHRWYLPRISQGES